MYLWGTGIHRTIRLEQDVTVGNVRDERPYVVVDGPCFFSLPGAVGPFGPRIPPCCAWVGGKSGGAHPGFPHRRCRQCWDPGILEADGDVVRTPVRTVTAAAVALTAVAAVGIWTVGAVSGPDGAGAGGGVDER